MINENFVFLGATISVIGGIAYLIDTIKGRVKPNKVTWFLWALAPLIAFAAQIQEGVGLGAVLAFSVGFMPLLIFFASFLNKKSEWKITRFDIFCGALSLMGIALWFFTKDANLAILFAILADALAALPTVVKAWYEPETENAFAFFTAAINAGITILTIRTWDFATAAFPIYILLVCILFTTLIKFKPGLMFSKKA